MKEIVKFLKQRQNVKYSLWVIIFGLIFAFSFQVNRAQISQILEKPIRIIPGTKAARQYQVSGWQGAYAKDKESILKVALPEKKTYQMVIKAFSCSPPDARDQRMEVHFNDVALDRLKFRKTPKWQKFSVNIPSYFIKETSTIKFVYTQDIHLSPIAFDSLEFKNYIFRIKDLYLLFDSPKQGRVNYLSLQVLGYSLGFAISLLLFWLFYSRFLSFTVKMKFSRAAKIDFLNYLPSIVLLSLFALISFFSSYHFVYSLKAFFVLALAPTAVLKLLPYKDLSLHFVKIVFKFISRDIEKTCSEIKRAYSAFLSFLSFLKRQITTFRRFLIHYHKTNLSSAFILDFMLLLVLCATLLMFKTEWLAERIANLAYFLLVIGVVMKFIQFAQKEKICSEIKRAYSAFLSFLSFLKRQITTFRRFLIRYHKTNLSSAFILDFILLLVLCPFLLMVKAEPIAERIANLAYFLLVIGVVMEFIQLTRKEKTGDGKRFIRIRKKWIIPFQRLILRIAKRCKVPLPKVILRIAKRCKVPFQRLILRIAKRGKVPFKKIILWLVSILLVSLFLWLILPGKGVEVTQLIPQETFVFFSLKIDSEAPGTSDLINNFDWRIRWGARLLGPVEIAALATPAVSKEEPDYLFLVKNNRLIKISRLLRRSIDKAMISEKPFKKSKYKTCQILCVERPRHPDNVCSYTLFRDIALFSNNPSLLKASLDQFGKETFFISGEALSDFRELQSSGQALFFINNSHFELSYALKSLEEKSAYAILPTVGSLNYLGGYFNIFDADSLKGSLLFRYSETVDIKKGQEDIYFLVGLVKRLCRANGLNFEEEIIMDNHCLKLNFKLSGLKAVLNNLLTKEKK